MGLKEITVKVKKKQEQQRADEKTINKLRFEPSVLRTAFVEIVDAICWRDSFGKTGFLLDDENERAIELICQYINREPDFESVPGRSFKKGLWLYGNFGSGKSMLMQAYTILKTRIKDKVGFKTCEDMNRLFMEVDSFSQKKRLYSGIKVYTNRFDEVERVFDDLGEEEITVSDYDNKVSVMAHILSERYKGLPNGVVSHITTNLDIDEVGEDYGGRVKSRIHKMFNVIKLGARAESIDYREYINKL